MLWWKLNHVVIYYDSRVTPLAIDETVTAFMNYQMESRRSIKKRRCGEEKGGIHDVWHGAHLLGIQQEV